MGKDPSFPFYANDWLSSPTVLTMSLDQQGAYLRLLCFCWASGDCSLPDDDETLAKLSGMGEGWLKGGSELVRKCFEPIADQPGKITNRKLLDLWLERQEWREKSRLGGVKSGETRRLQRAKGGSTTVPTKRQPKGNSSSSSSSSFSKPLNPPLDLDAIAYPDGFDTPAVREAWSTWLREKPSPYKNLDSVNRSLRTYCQQFGTAARLVLGIDLALAGGWKGLSIEAAIRAEKATTAGSPSDPRGNFAAADEWLRTKEQK